MKNDQLKTNVHRVFTEIINKGNIALVDELLDKAYVAHSFPASAPGSGGTVRKKFQLPWVAKTVARQIEEPLETTRSDARSMACRF